MVSTALTTRRSRSSTRRSAWTAACASVVAATATAKEGVTLQPCGVSAKTVWIVDTNDSTATLRRGYVPLINGSDTNFSHPFVLTYPGNGFPTDKPRPQLFVNNLTGFSQASRSANSRSGLPVSNEQPARGALTSGVLP